MNDDLDRQFERLLRDPLTRRRILQRGAAGALSASALAYLAACGTDEPTGGANPEEAKAIPKGKIARRPVLRQLARCTSTRSTRRSRRSRRRTAPRSSTSRRSTTTPSSSARSASSTTRAIGRARHPRRDGLDGRAHDPARLRPEVRQVDDAEREREPDRAAQVAAVRPEARVLDALAVGDDGDHLPQGQGEARAEVGRGPVRSGLQGQGHDADGDARLGRSRRRLAWAPTPRRPASTSS